MITPGMIISDRYEIIEKIGSGGMADVYKARCLRLNRLVAVKVLKREFSSDKTFIAKFKDESRAAAGLSHPNVVSVYDVGCDGDFYYIVMELVEGITLKKFIERKGRLDLKEAIGITIQIAQGMEAAHENHIVHRDIKPQNIIISRDGKVKVADFGIARAVSKNTYNQGQNPIGSVHYLSPEQARGGYSDERSDIYSLGVTLYEMLSGQLPFAGDNTVSIALLHIQAEAKPVKELVPSVPFALDRIVQKCMQKRPENRYQSVSELIVDLKHSITNPEGDFVTLNSRGYTQSNPTRRFTDEEVREIQQAVSGKKRVNSFNLRRERTEDLEESDDYETIEVEKRIKREQRQKKEKNNNEVKISFFDRIKRSKEQNKRSRVPKERVAVERAERERRYSHSDRREKVYRSPKRILRAEEEELDSVDSRWEKIVIIVSIVVAIILTIVLIAFAAKLLKMVGVGENFNPIVVNTPVPTSEVNDTVTPEPLNTVKMPSLTGYTFEGAVSDVLNKISPDFTVLLNPEEYSDAEKGTVIRQTPKAGSDVILGKGKVSVTLVLSAGPEPVVIPSVAYMSKEDARSQLENLGLIVKYTYESSEYFYPEEVIGTDPGEDTVVHKGDTVFVYVSRGSDTRYEIVPDLVGHTALEAKEILESRGLLLGYQVTEYNEFVEKGYVIEQDQIAGSSVAESTKVGVTVSLGSKIVPTPEPTPMGNFVIENDHASAPVPTPTPTPIVVGEGQILFWVINLGPEIENPVKDGAARIEMHLVQGDTKVVLVDKALNYEDFDRQNRRWILLASGEPDLKPGPAGIRIYVNRSEDFIYYDVNIDTFLGGM